MQYGMIAALAIGAMTAGATLPPPPPASSVLPAGGMRTVRQLFDAADAAGGAGRIEEALGYHDAIERSSGRPALPQAWR